MGSPLILITEIVKIVLIRLNQPSMHHQNFRSSPKKKYRQFPCMRSFAKGKNTSWWSLDLKVQCLLVTIISLKKVCKIANIVHVNVTATYFCWYKPDRHHRPFHGCFFSAESLTYKIYSEALRKILIVVTRDHPGVELHKSMCPAGWFTKNTWVGLLLSGALLTPKKLEKEIPMIQWFHQKKMSLV